MGWTGQRQRGNQGGGGSRERLEGKGETWGVWRGRSWVRGDRRKEVSRVECRLFCPPEDRPRSTETCPQSETGANLGFQSASTVALPVPAGPWAQQRSIQTPNPPGTNPARHVCLHGMQVVIQVMTSWESLRAVPSEAGVTLCLTQPLSAKSLVNCTEDHTPLSKHKRPDTSPSPFNAC